MRAQVDAPDIRSSQRVVEVGKLVGSRCVKEAGQLFAPRRERVEETALRATHLEPPIRRPPAGLVVVET